MEGTERAWSARRGSWGAQEGCRDLRVEGMADPGSGNNEGKHTKLGARMIFSFRLAPARLPLLAKLFPPCPCPLRRPFSLGNLTTSRQRPRFRHLFAPSRRSTHALAPSCFLPSVTPSPPLGTPALLCALVVAVCSLTPSSTAPCGLSHHCPRLTAHALITCGWTRRVAAVPWPLTLPIYAAETYRIPAPATLLDFNLNWREAIVCRCALLSLLSLRP